MYAPAAKDTLGDVKTDIKNGANRAGNEIRQAANNVRSDFQQADLEGAAYNIGQKVHDYIDTATREINDVSTKVTSEIRTNPVQSTVVALAVGFLFGLLARR